jgi:tetratricopeptide (TPR) repeat protein
VSIITLTERATGADGVFEAAVRFEGGGEHLVGVADPLAGNPNGERLLTWYFEEHLRYPFLDSDLERKAVALLGDYGRGLFEQVFVANQDCAYEFRRAQDAGFDGWRLEVVGGVDFHRLHWEALRDDGTGAPLGVRVPVVRRVENADRGFDVEAQGPTLNVLVVTARPHGARDVGYRTISRPLLAALRQASVHVRVDLLRPGSWRALESHLRAVKSREGSGWYGIVHFDVHGAVASPDEMRRHVGDDYLLAGDVGLGGDDEDAYLFFETPKDGVAEPVSTARVAGLLVEHRVPVAVLNACQSAMQSRGNEASLAQCLVEAGVPVSVGMAYSVTVTAAELMMPVVYRQLAGGEEILSAVHAGRRELFDVRARRAYFDQDLDLEDWVLPVVFSQRPVELRPRAATPEQAQQFYSQRAQLVVEPKPEYGFVGRDLDVQAIERLMLGEGAHNELLVMGMAGAGKSTLLAHLGWWWQETGLVGRVLSFSYEDRAWTVDQILEKIINELLDEHEQALAQALNGDAQIERVATLLRADRHLLVLDNAESITATPASIPHSLPESEQLRLRRFLSRLTGGKSLVLLGSRGPEEWLAKDAFASNVYKLGGLDPQATSILLERIITRHGGRLPDSDTERDALDELVGILGGYPLALTVVLPVVAATAPSEVLAEIKRGGEDMDPGSIIQHAVELSHGRLDPTTQNSLILLAPFTSVVPTVGLDLYRQLLETHEPVKALGSLDLPGALDEAIKVGLATPGTQSQNHARLQPLLPYFLRTRLVDQPEVAAAVAHAHHDLYQQLGPTLHGLLTSHEPDERAAGRAFTYVEYANLTTALDYGLANGNPVTPFIAPLEEFLDQAHQQHARRQLLERVIQAISQPGPLDRRAELAGMHNLAGITAIEQHHLDDAHAHHQAELALRQQLDDRRAAASTYHQLGVVAEEQRRFEEAEAYYKKALEIKLEFDDRHGAATSQSQLGILLTRVGRVSDAIRFSLDALAARLGTTRQWSRLDLQWLKRQRGLVGADQFRAEVAQHSNDRFLEQLLSLLDQVDELPEE